MRRLQLISACLSAALPGAAWAEGAVTYVCSPVQTCTVAAGICGPQSGGSLRLYDTRPGVTRMEMGPEGAVLDLEQIAPADEGRRDWILRDRAGYRAMATLYPDGSFVMSEHSNSAGAPLAVQWIATCAEEAAQ